MTPSYDDLARGIPDIAETGLAEQLSLLLRASTPNSATPNAQSTPNSQFPIPKLGSWELGVGSLYACLRAANRELQTLLDVARDFSPRVMRVSDGEVLLDVSGLGALIGEPPVIARELRRALKAAGAAASVAIAETQTAARLLAHVETVHGACNRRPLTALPVQLLRQLEVLPPALNHRDRDRPYEIFEKWGIATLGELAALPPADLSSRLGRRGVALHRLARGLDARPFVPDGETPRFIGRLELEWPIDALEPLSFVFARLLEPLALSLELADRGAAAIRLELRLTDRATHTRVLQLPAPMRDPKVLRTLLLLDLESQSPAAAIDIVTIELDPAPARITQFSLLQRALPSPETLSTLTARLSALVGESRVGSPVILDTHRPGAFRMTRYAPDGARGAPGASGASGALVLRRQRVPPAIRVRVEHGRPVYLAAAKRGMPQGAVVQAAGPWRISGGWWMVERPPMDLPPKGGSYNRDEWDVALSSGIVCRVYQDRASERWFLDGVYD